MAPISFLSLVAATLLAGSFQLAHAQSCSAVTSGCSAKAATAYCSSYLGISATTVTSPKSTFTVTTSATLTITSYTSTFVITTSGSTCPPYSVGGEKRARAAPGATYFRRALSKPPCLSNYKVSTDISSACSCFSLSTSTSTVRTGKKSTTTRTSYAFSRVSSVTTVTKTLLPAPTCTTLAVNSTNNFSEFYAGCGFQRAYGACVSFDSDKSSSNFCDRLLACAEVVNSQTQFPGYNSMEYNVDPSDNTENCDACLPAPNDSPDDFNQYIQANYRTAYGYQ